jgi:hypothetical protein
MQFCGSLFNSLYNSLSSALFSIDPSSVIMVGIIATAMVGVYKYNFYYPPKEVYLYKMNDINEDTLKKVA